MAWDATVTFPDQNLTPDSDNGVVKLTDTLGDLTQEDGTSSSAFANLHYAVAKDLYTELTGQSSGTTVTLSLHNDADSNGAARVYTLKDGVFTWGTGDDQVRLSSVKMALTFRDASGAVIQNPESSDAHVRSFDIVLTTTDGSSINARALTVSSYHSLVNGSALPPSTTVNVGNSLVSNHTSGTSSNGQTITTLSNPMEKQVRTLDKRGDNSDASFAESNIFQADWKSTESGGYDTISDGQHAAQYRIALNTVSYPDNATVTITDTLPAGMKLVTSTNNGSVRHPIRLVYGTNIGQANASYAAKDTLEGNNRSGTYLSYATETVDGREVVTFTFHLNGGLAKGQYYITYTASFLDDETWQSLATGQRSYVNTANATVAGKTYSDSATLNIDRGVSPVVKSQRGTLTNDRRGKYQIVINPAASDLQADSDTVVLTDELTGWNEGSNKGLMNPELDLTSVHLYLYDPNADDGIGVELDKTRYNLHYEHADGDDGCRRIVLTVPDSTALVFVYDYEFKQGEKGDWGTKEGNDRDATVFNTATIAGQLSQRVEEHVRRADSEGTGSTRALSLYKIDAQNHANTLTGSEFDLYESTAADPTVWNKKRAGISGDEGREGGRYRPHMFNLATKDGELDHNALYCLVETKAPEGYGLAQRYLVWLDKDQTEAQAWEKITGSADGVAKAPALGADGQPVQGKSVHRSDVAFISYYGGSLYVEDAYQSITVTKNWSGSDGKPLSADDSEIPNEVQLQLKQAVQGSADWKDYGEVQTVNKESDWKHTWSQLPQADENGTAYVYKVVEADAPDGWKTTYLNDDGISSGNITVTNVRWYSLPGTGGVPVLWLWIGGGIIAAAGIVILVIRRMSRV